MKTAHMYMRNILLLVLLCLLLFQPFVTALTNHTPPALQKKHITYTFENKSIPSTLKKTNQHTEGLPPQTTPRTSKYKRQASVHENNQKDCRFTMSIAGSSAMYWVEAGIKGDGTSEANPAGNISYILEKYNLANDIVKVKSGIYSNKCESFPLLLDSQNVTLEASEIFTNTIIKGGKDSTGIQVEANNPTIRGFTITNFQQGINIADWSNSLITFNNIQHNEDGIYLENSRNHTVSHNILRNTSVAGLRGVYTNKSSIVDNSFINNVRGINLRGWDNRIQGNSIKDNSRSGIYIRWCANNIVKENTLRNNGEGIVSHYSSTNTVVDNVMSEHKGIAFHVQGWQKSYYDHIIRNNTVDGQNIYYFFNKKDIRIEGIRTPQLTLAYCKDVLVTNSHIMGGLLHLASTKNSTINQNLITDCSIGILLRWNSTHNLINDNVIRNNRKGIKIVDSIASNNIVKNNLIKNNSYGVVISSLVKNLVYRNAFIENRVHATCYGGTAFNSSTIGNYWDDYNGTDANGDGIGDTPYLIPGWDGSVDYLPAMAPFKLPHSPGKPRSQGLLRSSFVIPVVVLATAVFLGVFIVHHVSDPTRLRTFIHHTRLKTTITTITAYLRQLLTDREHETPSIQRVLEAAVDKLGKRLEERVREEGKPDLVNIVKKTFSLLGKRFDVIWKEAWTVGEYLSTLIERAGPSYSSLLREGYRHLEELLYAEREDWRDSLLAIHHILIKITEKVSTRPPTTEHVKQ